MRVYQVICYFLLSLFLFIYPDASFAENEPNKDKEEIASFLKASLRHVTSSSLPKRRTR
jgi:hypothetical protein